MTAPLQFVAAGLALALGLAGAAGGAEPAPNAPASLETVEGTVTALSESPGESGCTRRVSRWQELCQFTDAGRYGYFRHILRAADLPVGEILAAHIRQAQGAHEYYAKPDWGRSAARELITLLRDDYPALVAVLGALSDIISDYRF